MKSYNIAVIPGDGTGPEVIKEGLKVLDTAIKKFGIKIEFHHYDFGGARYLRTGEVLPYNAVNELQNFDAIYLGAIGHPDVKPGILEKGILLRLRFELDLYINYFLRYPVWTVPNFNGVIQTPQRHESTIHRTRYLSRIIGQGYQAVRESSPVADCLLRPAGRVGAMRMRLPSLSKFCSSM